MAYLLNPLMKLIDGKLFSLFKGKMKSEKRRKNIKRDGNRRCTAVFGRHYCPADRHCDRSIHHPEHTGHHIHTPAEVRSLVDWINDIAKGDSQIADIAEEVITQAGNFFENWMKNTSLPQAEVYISSITSGVITGVKFVINILVGLIISVYVMASQGKVCRSGKENHLCHFKPYQSQCCSRDRAEE